MEEQPKGDAAELDAELARLHAEAAAIDPYKYQRRNRVMAAIGLGALGAGLVYVVIHAIDVARNPCERVRNYYCGRDAKSAQCASYDSLMRDSVDDESAMTRGGIRHQCELHINRLAVDENVIVP